MAIVRPRFIAIDSSALGNLVRDINHARGQAHNAGVAIMKQICEGSVLPILTLTMIAELLQHDDDLVVAERLDALASIPNLAYVKSLKYPSQVGSIIDIGAAEVDAAFIRRLREPAVIAEHAKSIFLAFKSGRDLILQFRNVLPELKRHLIESRKASQILSSLVHVDVLRNREQSLRVVLRDVVGFRQDIDAAARGYAAKMATELDSHGDKNMDDPHRVAHQFISGQLDRFTRLSKSKLPVLEALCAENRVDFRAVNLDMTFEEFCWMPVYQRQLDILAETLRLPCRLTEFDVPSAILPHWIVRRDIFRARRGSARAAGSDLGDDHLAALACYADLTIVDKRTYAYLQQGLRRSISLRQCLREVARVRDTCDLAVKLSLACA